MFIEIDFPEVPQPCKGGMCDSRFLQGSVKNFTHPQDDLVFQNFRFSVLADPL